MSSNSSSNQRLFALRGATCAARNDADEILEAVSELLNQLIEGNNLKTEQMVSCIFTATTDLNAEFPAVAAREIGLNQVPLICTQEIDVPGALRRCVRVMLHYYAPVSHKPKHIYLREAKSLRRDLEAAQ